jgi:hypothetical protein
VDDPFLVRGFERVGDLQRDPQRLVQRQRAARDALLERLALDELHDEEVAGAGFFEPEQRGDVRMIQRRERLGFTLEAGDAIGIGRERFGEHLDRDRPSQLRDARDRPRPSRPRRARRRSRRRRAWYRARNPSSGRAAAIIRAGTACPRPAASLFQPRRIRLGPAPASFVSV